MKPGAAYALRRLLEAALALLEDEDEEMEQAAAGDAVQPAKPRFFGEDPPKEETTDGKA